MTITTDKLASRRAWLTKVPAITAVFWVIKVLSTTIGETFADYLSVNVGLGPAVTDAVMFAVLATALFVQFRTRSYTPWVYWLCVVLVSIVGTQLTDFFTDTLGVSLYISTAVFAVILAVVFVVWYSQERTLAITSIDTPRRESFYWGAILTTFALGTAAGDLATEALSLGFRNGVLIFGGLIVLTWLAYRFGGGQVLTFWIAYVLTRPLGASLGDLLTQDKEFGGLALGASITSTLFFATIIVLVTREQLLVNRYGVAEKGTGPIGGRGSDFAWAGAGAVVVIVVASLLSGVHTTPTDNSSVAAVDQGASVVAEPGATGASTPAVRTVHTTTRLGNLNSFAVIVNDLKTKVTANDLAGGKTRAKDLEVAWDDAEAGLKPRDSAKWHQLDDEIDGVLTALRASNPTQSECAANIATLLDTVNKFDGV